MKSLRFVPYSENQTEFDAYVASSRGEQVPASVTSKKGGNKYNNFDTNSSLFYSSYVLDKAEDVPAVVAGQFGAGRVQHGDFQWTFNNSVDDAEYEVNAALKKAVSAYKTSLVKIFGGENIDVPGTDPTPTPDPDPNPGTDPTPSTPEIEGTVTCTFSGTSSNIVASNSAFTFTGTKHNAKTEDTTIDGVTYKTSLKMESGTEVTFTTKQKMTLYVYYGASGTSKTVLVDGAECTGDPTTVTLEAGTHKIARKVATTVALIKLVPVTTE